MMRAPAPSSPSARPTTLDLRLRQNPDIESPDIRREVR